MKKNYFTLLLLTLFCCPAKSQCPFNPTVIPLNLLCPNESDTLWTQVYDSYQWYENGSPIPGAVNQYYVVSYNLDAGDNFSVEATDSSCTEMSPQVLVDGWAFLPPVVMHEGDLGWMDGQYIHLCDGDTAILILLQPYDTLIQWFNGPSPIPGATDDTLLVTASGSYTVQGAPVLCPNFVQQLGLFIDFLFHQPIVPVITLVNDTLYASPNAISYQWYLNASAIPGATNQWYAPIVVGVFSVSVVDTNQCPAHSGPFIITDVTEINNPLEIKIAYEGSSIFVQPGACEGNELNIYDATGRLKQKLSGKTSYEINTSPYEDGIYLMRIQCGKEFFVRKILLQK